jgi:AcrR family transcriptional regulator
MEAFRHEIAERAMAIFLRDGVAGVSMRGLAQDLSISTMGLYRYFRTKDELLAELWHVLMVEANEIATADADAQPDPAAQLTAFLDALLGYWLAHPESYLLATSIGSSTLSEPLPAGPSDIRSELGQPLLRRMQAMTQAEACNLRDPQLAADLIYAKLHGFLYGAVRRKTIPPERIPAVRADVVLDMLAGLRRHAGEPEPCN